MKIVGIWILILWVAGCSQNGVLSEAPPAPADDQSLYVIGVGDQLTVQVWKSPDLSVSVPVRPDGNISVPLAGDIKAEGQSAEALANLVAAKLNQFIRNPEVTVIVTGPTSAEYTRRIRITGAVNAPQSAVYKKGVTVLDLVLGAGGLTPYANGNKAVLYRKVGNEVKSYAVKLNDILEKGKLETNYTLAPADIITVPERAF